MIVLSLVDENKNQPSGLTHTLFTGDMAQEHADIDVFFYHPEFWKKVLPDLVTPDSMIIRLKEELVEE